MDQNEDLTDLGYHLADLPVEPHLGKMVLCAVVLKCLDPILTIACTLAYRDPFILPAQGGQKKAAIECRKRFTANTTQLLGQLRAIGFVRARGGSDIRDVNLNSENWSVVKAALVAGMYPNLVHVNQESSLPSSYREKKIPPPGPPTDWLIYDEMSRGHRMASVRCCSMVTPITVAIFGGCAKLPSSALQEPSAREENSDSETEELSEFSLDDWLIFQLDSEAAGAVFELRQKWQNLFIKRIRCPSKPWTQQDEAIIRTLVSMKALCLDEASLSMNPLSEDPPSSSNSSCSVSLDPSAPSSSGKPAFPSVRHFIMKSSSVRNIEISQQKGIWSTTPSNEGKLTKAFLENNVIILIFSVQGSGHFQESCQDWGFMGLGVVFSVEWIHRESVPFLCTQHILNTWNDNKKVQISRDGQIWNKPPEDLRFVVV
ncbi:hypothetical protein F7725_015125 [Dissostichus mawsoni]|uniref:YTH domain-containing family protein n=1 Tax=Dissostichus mawsoni TaxID=36200 RepID=A0A7J5YK09_DISMA|nr:hypothetical protein F7725_015125 [Dissostichus mawsoni]